MGTFGGQVKCLSGGLSGRSKRRGRTGNGPLKALQLPNQCVLAGKHGEQHIGKSDPLIFDLSRMSLS